MGHKTKRRISQTGLSVLGITVALLFLFPYVSMLLTAVKPKSDITDIPPTYFPKHWEWDNFIKVFQELPFGMYIRSTILISVSTMILGLLASIPAGYYVARNNFRLRTPFLLLVLVTQMFSPTTLLIGIYREMSSLHLVNSYLGLIIINASFNLAFSVWILSSFFKSIPIEIEEAAAIDGASRFQTFRKISLPLALPGIVTTAIFTFIAAWNEYVVAYTLASSPSKQPFSVGLSLLIGYYEVKWNYLFAGSLIAIIPVFILFVMIEKYLVSGLTAGSVK
ncbi:MAG: carbohydrate ABC transporter permease [Actinobacteria bacterium]|nr:carbohydrate ABC transporter permease [Actinomycetota bacterium]